MQECSEYPLVVDMSNRCFYLADRAMEVGGWNNLPCIAEVLGEVLYYETVRYPREGSTPDDFEDFLDYYDSFECKSVPVKAPEQIGIDTDLSEILFYCRIPFEKVDMDEVRSIFQEWTEAPLSVETRRELDREDEDVKQHEW